MNSGEGRSNDRPASANGESSTRTASSPAFPPGFVWGVATSAHQVEGNNSNNQWAAWENAGRIKSRDRVELACDWWRNAEQDFDIAQSLGVNALRLSLEWSRIEPAEGSGTTKPSNATAKCCRR
jgi:beta-glucosidase